MLVIVVAVFVLSLLYFLVVAAAFLFGIRLVLIRPPLLIVADVATQAPRNMNDDEYDQLDKFIGAVADITARPLNFGQEKPCPICGKNHTFDQCDDLNQFHYL